MNSRILFVFVFLFPFTVTAQEYYIKQYRVEKGLPSDIIKASIQDSLGYFWIATDEGLVKYDGINFTSYRKAMRSNYAKGFLKTRTGRLLAFSDLDVLEINNQGDTVIFNSICPVSRVANDSSLTYPKLLFEDFESAIWVSESQAVVRLKDKKLKRFEFDIANRSTQFLRAFSFFEDRKHNLFITSFQGNVFKHNPVTDAFEPVAEKFPPNIESVSVAGNKLIIGCAEGVFQSTLKKEGGFEKPVLKMKIPLVSYVAAIPDGKYFIATRNREHYIADLDKNVYTPYPNLVTNINHAYLSAENDLWISGNEGLIMTHENLFQKINPDVSDFIESIAEDVSSPLIYYATSRTLNSYHRDTKENRVILDIPNGYFQSLLFTPQGLWVANAFQVFLWKEGKVLKKFDFTRKTRFVTDLSKDSEGNIWLTMPGNSHAYRIDSNLKLDSFRVDFKNSGVINIIQGGKDGTYIASSGKSSYLFFKSFKDSVFRNASLPLSFVEQTEFNATDLEFINDQLWLATTEGLLKIENGNVRTINLGDQYIGLPVKSVYLYSDSKIMASTAYGMVFYDYKTGQHDLFNESSGLLSNTITNHGFFVGVRKRIWIGTAKGLCATVRPLSKLSITPKPLFISLSANGDELSLRSKDELDYGSFVSFEISSITFPENEVTLQYRILPDSNWITTENSAVQFSALKSGTHSLEVRAKKNGLYTWSQSSLFDFTVSRPYWQRGWFYVSLLGAALLLMAITTVSVNARNRYRTRKLQKLVDEQTQELRVRNEELLELNNEKNSLISIVAHDLKSPLRQIMGLLSLIKMTAKPDQETQSYLGMVEESTMRLDGMILKILDVDAIDSKKLNLNPERLNFSALLSEIVKRYQTEGENKRITLHEKIEASIYITADKGYLEQVLENLLSNAIKFSPFDRNVYISLKIIGEKAVCEIKDEGPGISESDMKKLFGKYQKLSAKPTGTETSSGLGLSIVKKFVLAMKGEIWCESEYEKGASFFVSFMRIK